ncbi:MAG: aminotransferase class IV [Verrucomicrobia bacterium]|nr:aminotransferase class IV [Verrucomicrobiota bacterium]
MTNYIQANTDGKLHPADKPSISPLNRGFLYGDAIYEVWRTYDGIVFAWDEHWQRLERSARALDMALPLTQDELLKQIKRTVSAFCRKTGERPELYIRLQTTRGAGAIGLNTLLADKPSYVLLVQTLKVLTPEQVARGIKLGLAKSLHRNHPDALNPLWKTGNYLNNILCLREAIAAGAEEVVMTNLAGEITESAVSNIGFVRDGVLHTPPLSAGMLEGITRAAVLGPIANAAGVKVVESTIRPEELASFSECFLTGTTREVHPVNAIDDVRFTIGPGTVTAKLQTAFADYVRAYVKRHKKLRVLPRAPKPVVTTT